MGQLLLKLLVGALAGIAVWMLLEPLAPRGVGSTSWGEWEMKFILGIGAVIGLAVGALNGWMQGSRIHLLRGAGLGLVFGMVGAPLGYQIGGGIVNALFPNGVFISPEYSIVTKTIARTVALTPIGVFLGLAIGASSLNLRRTIQGGVGGLIGAAAGGLVFDTVGAMLAPVSVALSGVSAGGSVETGAPSRGLYAALLGGLIALFIGIVDLIARSAWVRLTLGRNEGKEWPIDSPQVFLGRSEKAGVPLFGDPDVAPMHACIIQQGKNAYVLADGGSPGGTYLNGQRISQAPLFHGANIRIGSFNLKFLMKHGAAPARGPEAYQQAYPIGVQPGQPAAVAANPAPGSLYNAHTPAAPTPVPGSVPSQSMPTQAYAPSPSQPTQMYGQIPGGLALSAMDGPLAGRRFPITTVIELGREAQGVPLPFDTNASRRHASVAPNAGGVTVIDLGSTNGTFVNGQRVQMANAGIGDLIKIGVTTFRVELG